MIGLRGPSLWMLVAAGIWMALDPWMKVLFVLVVGGYVVRCLVPLFRAPTRRRRA